MLSSYALLLELLPISEKGADSEDCIEDAPFWGAHGEQWPHLAQ